MLKRPQIIECHDAIFTVNAETVEMLANGSYDLLMTNRKLRLQLSSMQTALEKMIVASELVDTKYSRDIERIAREKEVARKEIWR